MTMLDRMRRHKGWLKWSLALIVLAFVLAYIPSFLQTDPAVVGASPQEVVAEVDGRELTAGDFQARYQRQVQAYSQQFGGSMNSQLLRQLGIDQQIINGMINEEVSIIEAERHGIRVSDDELAQRIMSIPGLQENGRFIGEARYEQLLRAQQPPMTKQQFEESLRRDMVIDKLQAALTNWMTISNQELDREYRQRNEKVKLQVVALTADQFRDKVTVTDADVAAYFEAHSAEYRVGEQRKIKYLLLDREQAKTSVAVPATDIQRFYNDNIQQYQTPEQVRASHILLETTGKDEAEVRKRAEGILAQVKGGADFAELARKVSEDKGSAERGGDLDYFSRGRMVPEFEEVAFSLPVGQVSDLVKSQFGFHIIKVVDKRPGTTRTLDEVRAQIQDQLGWQITDEKIAERAEQLAGQIDSADDLAAAAAQVGATVQESGLFQREDPIPGLGAAPQVAAAAFRLADKQVSEAVPSPRGPVFVTVVEKKDPYVPKLDDVKDRVRQDAIRAKARELSQQRAADIAAALKSASNFAAAAKSQGLEAKDTELVTREAVLPDIGVSPEVDKVAFSLPVGGVSDPIAASDGTVIVRVAERDDVTDEELRKGRESFRAQLLNERRNRFLDAYFQKARQRLSIEVNTEVLRRITAARQL